MRVTPNFGTFQYSLEADVYNKVDAISLEQVDKLAREDHTVVISCEMDLKSAEILTRIACLIDEWSLSLDYLKDRLWEVWTCLC